MHQVGCPSCGATLEYTPDDYIHLCNSCSTGFILDLDEGVKDVIGDHYIVPNRTDRNSIDQIFLTWIGKKYHKTKNFEKEFKIIGCYGICLPYWVVSLEANTEWSGNSQKQQVYSGQQPEYSSKFIPEHGRFGRKYRWSTLARRSTKEHWGLERLHKPVETVQVDWDGFPMDQSMGTTPTGVPQIYASKIPFKFEQANGVMLSGVQIPEANAVAKSKIQIQEFHRRICKTKVGTLSDHRTEVEVVGVQLVHIPFWIVRYAYYPQSVFQYFTPARERRMIIGGYTGETLDGELPLEERDRVMANVYVCAVFAIISLIFSIFFHPVFMILASLFGFVIVLSISRLSQKEKIDTQLIKGAERTESA